MFEHDCEDCDCQEAPEGTLSTIPRCEDMVILVDSQDRTAVVDHLMQEGPLVHPHFDVADLLDCTAFAVLVGDGEYLEVWGTWTHLNPYLIDTRFVRIYPYPEI